MFLAELSYVLFVLPGPEGVRTLVGGPCLRLGCGGGGGGAWWDVDCGGFVSALGGLGGVKTVWLGLVKCVVKNLVG